MVGDANNEKPSPAEQASGAGGNGNVPPPEHRFRPGTSGNPRGRPRAGASLVEWINAFAVQELTEDDLRRIARDKNQPWNKRAAAERCIRLLEAGDMADFEPWLQGKMSLEELRDRNVNVEVVKKAKTTRRVVGRTAAGEDVIVITREIELHDRAGAEFDRIMDRTEGRPRAQGDAAGDPSDTAQAHEPIVIYGKPPDLP